MKKKIEKRLVYLYSGELISTILFLLGVPPTKRGKHTLSQFLDEINRLFPMLRN